ncbi:efflux RND transporter periplasmic adaptor subunit [Sphingomonas sp. C3-2]|uniref:efflux RND transporter periplasmic adaptor subunit n=1 Tax=Sphingomonas sp. C3-2 TaxID=3062169 RepID=UPI00294B8D34|nr:efflux RND transporter periplasmic adaptor subunit [Sphingomonas sp. C3-2]WOK38260.1 efflux RND transporter periplasmic adaptor subunit [Sphingomonas sp. C3-2]
MNYESRFSENGEAVGALSDEDARRKRRRTVIAAALGCAAIIGTAGYFFSGGDEKAAGSAAASADKSMPVVTVMVPGTQEISRIVSATGSLAARREMPVGSVGEGGMVTNVLVEPGAWVRKGQVLATVERSVQTQQLQQLSAQINVARADARLAQAELDRAQALVARGFVSKADIDRKAATRDSADARVRVAEASLAEARARTGRLDIRAPEAGLVLTRDVEPGQVVSGGSGVLFRLALGGEMELRAEVAESDLQNIRVGGTANVTPVGTNLTFPGKIWQISPVVNPTSRQGVARILLGYDKALRPGGFASVNIVSGTAVAPLLPESAVLSDGKINYVYVVDAGDKVVRRDVQVGQVADAGVSVLSGISGNERIVLSAGAFLNPGEKIKPVLAKKQK